MGNAKKKETRGISGVTEKETKRERDREIERYIKCKI